MIKRVISIADGKPSRPSPDPSRLVSMPLHEKKSRLPPVTFAGSVLLHAILNGVVEHRVTVGYFSVIYSPVCAVLQPIPGHASHACI